MPASFHSRMAELTHKHLTDSLTCQEKEELSQLLESSPEKQKLFGELTSAESLLHEAIKLGSEGVESSWKRFKYQVFKNP